MSNFKPQFRINKKSFVYDTYRELKRKMAGVMKEHGVTEVCVSRSLRGEWGERYEYWNLNSNGKLVMGKSGWM
jgi:hypothetical protein